MILFLSNVLSYLRSVLVEKKILLPAQAEKNFIILPQYKAQDALYKAEMARKRIEKETLYKMGKN